MTKKIKNWMTHILGLIMMSIGAYMIWLEKPILYIMFMFGLGAISFMSFNKLGDFFLSIFNKFKILK